jgi:hypothetical protein
MDRWAVPRYNDLMESGRLSGLKKLLVRVAVTVTAAAATFGASEAQTPETDAWTGAQGLDTPEAYERFLQAHPESPNASVALCRLLSLKDGLDLDCPTPVAVGGDGPY